MASYPTRPALPSALMTRQYTSVKHVMEVTALSRSAAYALMDQLGAIKIGRSTRLMKAKLDTYLRELERGRVWTAAQRPVEDDANAPAPEERGEPSQAQLRTIEVAALAARKRPPLEDRPEVSANLQRWEDDAARALEKRRRQSAPAPKAELSANQVRLHETVARLERRKKLTPKPELSANLRRLEQDAERARRLRKARGLDQQ